MHDRVNLRQFAPFLAHVQPSRPHHRLLAGQRHSVRFGRFCTEPWWVWLDSMGNMRCQNACGDHAHPRSQPLTWRNILPLPGTRLQYWCNLESISRKRVPICESREATVVGLVDVLFAPWRRGRRHVCTQHSSAWVRSTARVAVKCCLDGCLTAPSGDQLLH